jgi:hypothetical protein
LSSNLERICSTFDQLSTNLSDFCNLSCGHTAPQQCPSIVSTIPLTLQARL